MDSEVERRICSLVGCIYYVPPPAGDTPASQAATSNAMHFYYTQSLASSTSAKFLLRLVDAKLMQRAVPIGYACLVGDSGESMVSTASILTFFQNADPSRPSAQFMICYPAYNSLNGSHIPLVFPANVVYYAHGCEVCIMKPIDRPHLSTRCLTLASDELVLGQRDPVFCFFFSESEGESYVVSGKVSSVPPNPMSYGLVAEFGLALRLRAGVVTDDLGRVVGTHICDFTIEGDSDQISTISKMVRRENSIAKVEIEENVEPLTLQPRTFEGMPPELLKQVQDHFALKSQSRKEATEQSRIYMLSQARDKLLFFNKRSSLLRSLTNLLVKNEDMDDNRSMRMLPRREQLICTNKHKRKRLWHVNAKSRLLDRDHGDDDDDDFDN